VNLQTNTKILAHLLSITHIHSNIVQNFLQDWPKPRLKNARTIERLSSFACDSVDREAASIKSESKLDSGTWHTWGGNQSNCEEKKDWRKSRKNPEKALVERKLPSDDWVIHLNLAISTASNLRLEILAYTLETTKKIHANATFLAELPKQPRNILGRTTNFSRCLRLSKRRQHYATKAWHTCIIIINSAHMNGRRQEL